MNAPRMVRVPQVDWIIRAETSAGEWAPGHWRNLFGEALVQRAIMEGIELRHADFHLVDNQWHRTRLLQRRHLRGAKVAHPEVADFTRLLQARKCAGHFLRI